MVGTLLNILTGAVLGFLGSIPVAGPISVLVLALGAANRSRTAIAVAAGGAVAEAIYAFLAFWGLSFYLARYPALLEASRGTTALILMIIGAALMRQKGKPGERTEPARKRRTGSGFLLGFTISILNPTFLLTWVAASSVVFASRILHLHPAEAFPFSLGVCGGIIGWFALLLWLMAKYRDRFHPSVLNRVVFWMGAAVFLGGSVFLLLILRNLFF